MEGIPSELTAANPNFPDFKGGRTVICFNLREGDCKELERIDVDPFFHWQGSYAELSLHDGAPLDDAWAKRLSEFADADGLTRVQKFLTTQESEGRTRAFYSPAKAKRWSAGMLGPDGKKPTTSENIILRQMAGDGSIEWQLVELPAEGDRVAAVMLEGKVLSRITYLNMLLEVDSSAGEACASIYGEDGSQAAWLDGSSLIQRAEDCREGTSSNLHTVSAIPSSCAAVRFVPIACRSNWLRHVEGVATCAVTGATLPPASPFASPLSTEIALQVGKHLGMLAGQHEVRLIASASMRANRAAMSADHDFTLGFMDGSDCKAVHFKGSNAVMLHGDLWKMDHGVSYILEEELEDFSNHAKEAALTGSSMHPRSIALLANGGPTVAINLTRFLLFCSPMRVFAICGLHNQAGHSGAAGSFKQSREQLEAAIESVGELAPEVFRTRACEKVANMLADLKLRPLILLEVQPGPEGTYQRCMALQPDSPNSQPSPGLLTAEEGQVEAYAKQAAQSILGNLENRL